jgi:hypothetical protein
MILALFAAIITGGVTLAILSAHWAFQHIDEAARHSEPFLPVGDVAVMLVYAVKFAPALTLLPVLAAVLLGEVLHIRRLLYYVVIGGLAAILMPLVTGMTEIDVDGTAISASPGLAVIATAGFAAGSVYWLFAGRHA